MPYADPERQREFQRDWMKRRRLNGQTNRTYNRTGRRARNMGALWAAKDRPCTDCGIKYPPYVMQFDHLDPSTKSGTVGEMAWIRSLDRLMQEIAKCEVVCANCHAELTWQRRQDTPINPPRSTGQLHFDLD